MNKQHFICLTFVCAAALSCEKASEEPDDLLKYKTEVSVNSCTKTTLNETSVYWETGDRLGAFDDMSGSTRELQFTLSTGAGSSSALFRSPDEFDLNASKYYFYYPYDETARLESGKIVGITIPVLQPYKKSSFDNKINISVGTTDNLENGVVLKNIFGILKFNFKGTKTLDRIQIISDKEINGKASIDPVTMEVSLISDQGTTIIQECENVTLTASGQEFLFEMIPGSYNLSVILFATDGTQSVNTLSNIQVERSKIKQLSSLTPEFKHVYYGTSNCILSTPEAEEIEFDASAYYSATINYDGVKGLSAATSADWIWTDVSSDFIDTVSYNANEGKIVVTKKKGEKGNATICLFDKSGTILWTFHIWVTDTPTDQKWRTYTWLDRMLGATSATVGDAASGGCTYQWGRSVPFVGSDGYHDTSSKPNFDGEATAFKEFSHTHTINNGKWSTGNAPVSLSVSIKNPLTYYVGSKKQPITGTSYDNHLWDAGQKKTIYDPCPEGYRVPSSVEAFEDFPNSGERDEYKEHPQSYTTKEYSATTSGKRSGFSWDVQDIETNSEITVWLPISGTRNAGDAKMAWLTFLQASYPFITATSSNDTTNGTCDAFRTGEAVKYGIVARYASKTAGSAIRCIKIE